MKLRVYLAIKGINISQFAEICGIKRGYLYNMLYGFRGFSKRVAEIIEEKTEGQVTYFSLRGEHKKKTTPSKRPKRKL